MTTTITMSPEEYSALVDTQNEPSKMLTQTLDNYKQKLDEAQKIIAEQERELSYYIIGGAKRKEEISKPRKRWTEKEDKVIHNIANSVYKVSGLRIGNKVLEDRTDEAIKSRINALGYSIKNDKVISK